jgi:hypothetical protein
MSNKKIFKSCFFLSFENKSLESEFEKKKNKKFTKYVNLQLGIILLLTIAMVTIISIYMLNLYSTDIHYKLVIITSYICLFVITTSFVLSFLLHTKLRIIKILYYVSYTLISLVFSDFRFAVSRVLNLSIINWYAGIFELGLRLVATIIFLLSFLENMFINLTIIVLEWAIYSKTVPTEFKASWINNKIFLTIGFFLLTLLVYVIDRRLKVSCYYRFKANRNSLWLNGVLENMNGGFLSIKNSRISYINPFMIKILDIVIPNFQRIESPRITDGKNYVIYIECLQLEEVLIPDNQLLSEDKTKTTLNYLCGDIVKQKS